MNQTLAIVIAVYATGQLSVPLWATMPVILLAMHRIHGNYLVTHGFFILRMLAAKTGIMAKKDFVLTPRDWGMTGKKGGQRPVVIEIQRPDGSTIQIYNR